MTAQRIFGVRVLLLNAFFQTAEQLKSLQGKATGAGVRV